MPRIRKVITGKLNSDASNDLMPQGDYVDALNVNVDADGVTSLLGNRKFKDGYMAEGYWYAGGYYDKLRRRVYCFLAHQNQKHRWVVIHVDAPAVVTLFENITDSGTIDILGWNMPSTFDASKVVKSIRVVHRDIGGDLVYFIDPAGRMLKFNFDKFFFGEYGSNLKLEYFNVIKAPPKAPPSVMVVDDATKTVNNLKRRLFQFRYRYVYDDDERSVWSSPSKLPLLPKNEDQEYYIDGTKANVINVYLNSGIKTVKKIEVAARNNVNNNWTDWYSVAVLNKANLSIADDSLYTYKFYNDGVYTFVDIKESNLLFDYVPDKANCMEIANGNVLVPAGITEGYDKEINLSVSAVADVELPSLSNANYTLLVDTPQLFEISFFGNVLENDQVTISFYYTDDLGNTTLYSFTYTVLLGEDLLDVVTAIVNNINASSAGVYVLAVFPDPSDPTFYVEVRSIAYTVSFNTISFSSIGSVAGTTDSIPTFKPLGRYKFGIAYYNNNGKTRGVYIPTDDSWTVDIPPYNEDTGDALAPFVTLSINNAPPSWADYFHIVRTPELTCLKSLFVRCSGVSETTDYGYLKIENLETHAADFSGTAETISYTFTEGDRVRILAKTNGSGTGVLNSYDFEILGVEEISSATNLKIKHTASMPNFTTTSDRFLIEIYTPKPKSDNASSVFYEIGERYEIFTDINGSRSHRGKTQDQKRGAGAQPATFKITEGDYYIRQRLLTVGTSGTTEDFSCFDQNFSDYWQSAVWSQGRPLVVDDSIKKEYYPGMMRHSLEYIHGTSINNLSRFYPDNFEEADISYGDILNMKTRENFIRVFQRNKTGMVPVLRQIYFDNANNNTVATSERILNKINYYAGDYGIDKYGLSLVSTDFGDYFIDDINRALVRASIDGITNVSDTFEMSKFFNTNVDNGYTALGAFDYEKRDVVMGIIDEDNVMQKIVRFSERRKGFQPRMSFTDAQGFLFIDGYLWTFKGVPYVHDSEARCTFYGVETAPFITVVFNGSVDFKKTFTNVSTISNRKWGCTAISTSTGQASNLKIEDFKQKEDGYDAAFLRDINSPKGLLSGDTLKGNWIEVKFEGGANSSLDAMPRDEISVATNYELTLCAVDFIESNLNKR